MFIRLSGMGSRMYQAMVESVGKRVPGRLQNYYRHPAGPTTIFFWAPFGKLALVVANLGDLWRPAEKLSLNQNAAILLTGVLYARWCMVIRPKNYWLASIQVLCVLTGGYQCGRNLEYRYNRRYHPKEAAESERNETVPTLPTVTETGGYSGAKQNINDYLPWIL